MKFRLLALGFVGAATAARGEDYPLLLNQRFQLHYNQWQSTLAPTTSTTQAVYEVEAGVPVFTYRLGALGLNGAVEYNKLTTGSESDSQTGISRYGARISLFPYRPFRLYLDYQHSQTPDLFGSGSVKGDVWGAGATYRSRIFQDLRVSYRHGTSHLEDQREEWSLWKLQASQRVGDTDLRLDSFRQEYLAPNGGYNWRLFVVAVETDTRLGREWMLRTRSQVQDSLTARWFDLSASFYGPISGSLHSLSFVSAGATMTDSYRMAASSGSESLVYAKDRWSLNASGAFSQVETAALSQRSRTGTLTSGATYALTRDWRVHGDLGVTALHQEAPSQDFSRTATSTVLGIARGGDVPELIRHTLFFFSDWSFDRRIREEYPPDFVPSELATEMIQRRMRQAGNFSFTADLWRMSDNTSEGHVDWARMTGQLQARGGLILYASGDYRQDDGMAVKGVSTQNSNFLLNGSYRLGVSTVTASMGYSNTRNRAIPGALVNSVTQMGEADGQSRYYSLGATSILWKVPVGVLALRYDAAMSPGTTTLSAWVDLSFRQVSLRVRYETSRMDNGFRNDRIGVDLLRWFDTISVGSWR